MFAYFFRRESREAGQPVGTAAALQLIEGRQLTLVAGDNDLAAVLMGDAVLLAEAVHGFPAADAVFCLVRAGFVIQARVNDAAIVARLMGGEMVFGFQDNDGG